MVILPAAMPVTLPAASMVALVTSLLLQLPFGVASANVVVDPAQTLVVPVIGAMATTVINVLIDELQPLLFV